MKLNNRDKSCLQHIFEYCVEIDETIKRFGEDKDTFFADSVYRNAVALCMLQIGELVGNMTDEYKAGHTDIPWSQIKRVRNLVAHSYGTVDFETIWEITQTDISSLKSYCKEEIERDEDEDDE